jgi:hypothetical protein
MSSILHNINGVIILIRELILDYEDSSPNDNEVGVNDLNCTPCLIKTSDSNFILYVLFQMNLNLNLMSHLKSLVTEIC